jgi:hypothetical protein
MLAVMRAVLGGSAPNNADIDTAEGVLRLLGLTPYEAPEVARRPLSAAYTSAALRSRARPAFSASPAA